MINDVLVSIICFTYNHKEYITDALEGCLAQQVDFKYEIIVHDDASVDGTIDIVRQYEQKYPGIIKGIYETENVYSHSNYFVQWVQKKIMSEARGKYVMWCEGDDYWIDPTKMSRQIEYLEQHPDCAMVVHKAAVLDMKHTRVSVLPQYWEDKNLSPEEIINHPHGFIESASMAYRMEDFTLKDFYSEAGVGDYTTRLYCLTRGRIYYMDRIMSVYRFGQEGSWQNTQKNSSNAHFKHCVNMIRFLDLYNQFTNAVYLPQIIKEIHRYVDLAVDIQAREDIFNRIADVNLRADIDYEEYLREIFRIYNQINNLEYCDKNIQKFIKKNKTVLIMGAGKYAAVLARQIMNNGMQFEGFVVSPDQNVKKEYLGKKVYKVDTLPFCKDEVGILVGIHADVWEEVKNTLMKNGIANYDFPYLFTLKDRDRV